MSAGGGMAGRYGITPGCGYMYGGCDTICHWWPCGSGWWYLQRMQKRQINAYNTDQAHKHCPLSASFLQGVGTHLQLAPKPQRMCLV